ncbi:MAG: protein kinase [Myxococcota bacterium]
MDAQLVAQVAALRKAGRYAEAAALHEAAGDPRGASQLYADVWEWERAIALAEEAGALALAYGHALAADDREALGRLLAALPDHPGEAQEAAELAEAKGRIVDAARLREAAGEVLEAAEAFSRAGELFEAARCFESAGEYRRAGMLYERRLKEDATDGEAALRLGRILAHFGRWDHAARALQTAEEDPERRDAALGLQVACFAALQMHDAAGACLARLRRNRPELPASVPAFLEATFGDEAGLAGLARGEEATQLLAGRYRVLHSLGAGGTGRVLLAHDGFYERKVAVKVLNVGTGSQGRDAYLRFAKEARVAAGLEHPNVVRVFEFTPDGPFRVMEHLAGGTLEARRHAAAETAEGTAADDPPATGTRLPYAVVHHVGTSILRGLEAVHRRGVVHRDLKPANVFFSAGGDVKLGDFGVAHLQDLGATLTGALMGTLAYMAPEQITGSERPTAATDLYAFGVILFRLVAGELPFPGPDFVAQHLESPVPVPSERGADARFDALLRTLLAKEQSARPESAEAVRASFEALDWRDPAADALQTLVAMERRPASLPAPAPEARAEVKDADRYTVIEEREGGGVLALDGALGRNVRIVPCDGAQAAWFKAWAAADHPFLQAVLDVDDEHGRAILEEPLGERLGQLTLEPARRAQVREQLREALAHVHAAGLVHGHVGPGRVRISRGRAVLMLPLRGRVPDDATPARDRAALETLVAQAKRDATAQREAPPK